jgi:hypothetical protein
LLGPLDPDAADPLGAARRHLPLARAAAGGKQLRVVLPGTRPLFAVRAAGVEQLGGVAVLVVADRFPALGDRLLCAGAVALRPAVVAQGALGLAASLADICVDSGELTKSQGRPGS